MSAYRSLPGWLYEPLPILYAIAGLLIMMKLDSTWGMASGLLLLSAAALIWNMRRTYRSALRRKRLRTDRSIAAKTASSSRVNIGDPDTLTRLEWKPAYESGNVVIDMQHRNLLSLAENLRASIAARQEKLDVELLLDDLLAAMERHNETEEKLLEGKGFPRLDQHREHHRALLNTCRGMAEAFHQDRLTADELLAFVDNSAIVGHIVHEDLKTFAKPTS